MGLGWWWSEVGVGSAGGQRAEGDIHNGILIEMCTTFHRLEKLRIVLSSSRLLAS